MKVPFFDLTRQHSMLKDEILSSVNRVMDQTAFSGGPFVDAFEVNLAVYAETNHAVCVNSGTSALHLAMIALGIGKGDEVIVPANTFIASAWGVSYVGATPVFVDCNSDTWNVDVAAVEKAITSKTKAIVGVHLYGQPCNIHGLLELCKAHDLKLIEDNAQGLGSYYDAKRAGTFGTLSCTSFYPGKNLGSYGEGGAILLNDGAITNHLKALRSHGAYVRYEHEEIGYNYRMEGFQAAILDVKIAHIETWNNRRRVIAYKYFDEVRNPLLKFQKEEKDADGVYHLLVVTTEDRDRLTAHLHEHGVGFAYHYPIPCHLQKAYASLNYKQGDMPNSEYLASHCVSLPMFPEMTDLEVEYVIDVLNKF